MNKEQRREVGSPLTLAAFRGHLPVVETLVSLGADVDFRGTCGLTALHVAACRGHDMILSALLTAGATKDAVDEDGKTPLMTAVQHGHLQIAETLPASLADISSRGYFGRDALVK